MKALLLLALLCLVASVRSDVVIDNFGELGQFGQANDTTINRFAAGPAFNEFYGPTADIIGGARDVYVVRTQGSLSLSVSTGDVGLPNIFGFDFSIGPGSGGTATFTWDGVDHSPNIQYGGLNHYDITQGGTLDALTLRLYANDLEGTLVFTFYTSSTAYLTAAVAIAPVPNSVTYVPYVFPFSAFTGTGDLHDIGAITLFIDSRADAIDLTGASIAIQSLLQTEKTATLSDSNHDGYASVGEVITYTISIENIEDQSNFPATNVIMTDAAPAGTTLVVGSVTTNNGIITSGNSAGNTVVSVAIPSIADNATAVVTFQVTVNALGCGMFNISNQANISASSGSVSKSDNPATNATSDATIVVYRGFDNYTMTCSAPASTTPGSTVVYSLNYCNVGASPASNVRVNMTIPANTVFVPGSSTSGWDCNAASPVGTICHLNVGSQAVGCATANFAVQVNSPVACTGVTLPCVSAVSSTCTTFTAPTVSVPVNAVTDMRLSKSARVSGSGPGTVVIFDLAYSNQGSANSASGRIIETVPQYSTFNAGNSTAGWSCSNGAAAGTQCVYSLGSLAGNGGSGTVSFAVQIPSTLPCEANSVSNTAIISDNCDSTNSTATATFTLNAAPSLNLVKSDNVTNVRPGDSVLYTITAVNNGLRDAPNSILTETVPQYTTFYQPGSPGWNCTNGAVAGTVCSQNIGTLSAQAAARTFQFAVILLSTLPPSALSLNNTVSLTTGCNASATANENNLILGNPELSVSKSDGGVTMHPGGVLVYSIGVKNNGTRQATGVTLSETFPTGTTFNSGSSSAGWTCNSTVCTLSVGTLAVGQTGSYLFAVNIPAPQNCNMPSVVNNVRISSDNVNGADLVPGDDTASTTTPVTGTPAFTFTETVNQNTVAPCGTVVYTLTYGNNGNACDTAAYISTVVPANTQFVSASSTAGWNLTGNSYTYQIGRLCPGSSGSVNFAVSTTCPHECNVTTFAHQSTMNGACTPSVTGSQIVVTITGSPHLTVHKDDQVADGQTVTPGNNIVYLISYSNDGLRNDAGVTLSEYVPIATTYNAASSTSGWNCNGTAAGSYCTFSVGRLNVGASGSVHFAVTVEEPLPEGVQNIPNTVTMVGTCYTTPSTSSVTTPVAGPPDLSICKNARCHAVVYTLDYSNIGDYDAHDVVITEHLPEGASLDTDLSDDGWDCDADGVCTLSVGLVSAGSANQAIFAVVPPVDFGCYENTVTIADTGADIPEVNTNNNQASATIGDSCQVDCPTCPTCPTCPSCPGCPTCPTCPTPVACDSCCPTCPTPVECDSCCPDNNGTCPDCPPEPCCPPCDSCCEDCVEEVENQVNFVFAGLIPNKPYQPPPSTPPTCPYKDNSKRVNAN